MSRTLRMPPDQLRVVYRCKNDDERARRCKRMDELVGKPFIELPNSPDKHKVLFVSKDGYKVRVNEVEMVYNDMVLMDYVSNYGEDGPLYRDTCEKLQLEVLDYAVVAYLVSDPKEVVN